MMYNTACVVNLYTSLSDISTKDFSSSKPSTVPQAGTCCGILVDSEQGWVLAHASCLYSLLEQGDLDLASLPLTLKEKKQGLRWEVVLQKEDKECRETVLGVPVSTTDVDMAMPNIDVLQSIHEGAKQNSTHPHRNEGALRRYSATLVHFFHCPKVKDSLQTLMTEPAWEMLDRKDADTDDNNNKKNSCNNNNNNCNKSQKGLHSLADTQVLLSSFMLLRLQKWSRPHKSTLLFRSTSDCHRGESVEICSTPFGGLKPDAFINSHSQGIISNLAGKDNCLLLSDARCILGGEGAPLYTFKRHGSEQVGYVTGVVVASLCWKNQEWVGFCVACDIAAVLQSASPLLQHLGQGHSPRSSLPGAVKDCTGVQGVRGPEVVMLQVGPTWGSGVIVERSMGIVLTCSHVIKDAHLYSVEMQREGVERGERVRVVYRQHPVHRQFDLAVVQTSPSLAPLSSLHPVTVAVPVEGMQVFVVGHALFGAEHHLPPSVTSGVISKVIKVNKVPVMVQTTCAVHPGASGGALVDTRGRLLAIIVSNTRENSSGASYPHVNMSIPVCTVWPVITRFLRTGDSRHLEGLVVRNSAVDAVWALGSMQETGMNSIVSKL